MLHTVNKSPFSHACLAECLRVCATSDAIVLIEDGVYAALAGGPWIDTILTKTTRVYALQPDAVARGIGDRLARGVVSIDYADFVQLCCEHPKMLAWY